MSLPCPARVLFRLCALAVSGALCTGCPLPEPEPPDPGDVADAIDARDDVPDPSDYVMDGEEPLDVQDTTEDLPSQDLDIGDEVGPPDGDDAPSQDTDVAADADASPAWLTALETEADWEVLVAGGDELKYVARNDARDPPASLPEDCYFQDMGRFEWHLAFLRTFDGLSELSGAGYATLVLQRDSRRLWAGSLFRRAVSPHPETGQRGYIAYSVYGESRPGSIRVADVIEVDARLRTCAPIFAEDLVFVPSGQEQRLLLVDHQDALRDAGVSFSPQ